MDNLLKDFIKVIEDDQMFPVYQVIATVEGNSIAGYEAFVRGPADSVLYTPQSLYLAAEIAGRLMPLEASATRIAIQQFRGLGLSGRLFKRFPPLFFVSGGFAKLVETLAREGIPGVGLVANLADHRKGESLEILRQAVMQCREHGISVALDELAVLTLTMGALRALAADFVTIDGHYVQGIHNDLPKQRLVTRVMDLAGSHSQLIAQGVECQEEYFTVRRLGVHLVQGYYFGRPEAQPAVTLSPRLFLSGSEQDKGAARAEDRVGDLAKAVSYIPPSEPTGDVLKTFLRSPGLTSLPVVYQGEPVGMIRRERLANLFLAPYGRDLYGKSPIARFMDNDPLVVDGDDSIKQVSQRITERGQAQENQDFIVVREGLYFGVGKVVDVLRRITEMQIRDAIHANPLTGLPGNICIVEEIEQLLRANQPFTACYFDLDNFKPYNDHYGYELGDQVIRFLGTLIQEQIDPRRDFLGHVGGDDFIALFRSEDWRERCELILQRFGQQAPQFYSEEDRRRGGIEGKDRQGQPLFFGLLSLSIGAVQPRECKSHHCVAAMAAGAKKQAKKMSGNSLFLERRHRPS